MKGAVRDPRRRGYGGCFGGELVEADAGLNTHHILQEQFALSTAPEPNPRIKKPLQTPPIHPPTTLITLPQTNPLAPLHHPRTIPPFHPHALPLPTPNRHPTATHRHPRIIHHSIIIPPLTPRRHRSAEVQVRWERGRAAGRMGGCCYLCPLGGGGRGGGCGGGGCR